MSKRDHIGDDGTSVLPGIKIPSSSVRRSGQPVILVFSQRPAARFAEADAMEPDEGFESLGSIAVRLVSEWSRPKMTLAQGRRGHNPAPASAHDPSWEDSDA
jgi:hypothetical protein